MRALPHSTRVIVEYRGSAKESVSQLYAQVQDPEAKVFIR